MKMWREKSHERYSEVPKCHRHCLHPNPVKGANRINCKSHCQQTAQHRNFESKQQLTRQLVGLKAGVDIQPRDNEIIRETGNTCYRHGEVLVMIHVFHGSKGKFHFLVLLHLLFSFFSHDDLRRALTHNDVTHQGKSARRSHSKKFWINIILLKYK